MDKIDRLGWAAGISFVSYGRRIGIRVSDADVLERIFDVLPPLWKPSPSPIVDHLYSLVVGGAGATPGVRRFHLLYGGIDQLARTSDLDSVLETLEADLHLHVAEFATDGLFVHAGVVGWRGRAIVIPGRTFTGKSTLVAALLRAGATYYSDEYAIFDGQGRVHPFPRPLSLRGKHNERARKISPESLGARTGKEPLPVGLVAAMRYRPGARWRPRPLSQGKALLTLLANTVPARRQPEAMLRTLAKVVRNAEAVSAVRNEAAEVVDWALRN